MSRAVPVSPQLRSRKSKMVPRVSHTQEESQLSGIEMVELSNVSNPAVILAGGEHNLTRTLIDPGGLDAGGNQGATGVLVDPSVPCNGHAVDEKLSEDGGAKQESDDEDGDAGDDNGRQPLLPARGEGRGEIEDEVVVVVEQEKETSLSIMLQVLLPYLIAGFGMVGAGMVLDVVQVLVFVVPDFVCDSLFHFSQRECV